MLACPCPAERSAAPEPGGEAKLGQDAQRPGASCRSSLNPPAWFGGSVCAHGPGFRHAKAVQSLRALPRASEHLTVG